MYPIIERKIVKIMIKIKNGSKIKLNKKKKSIFILKTISIILMNNNKQKDIAKRNIA